MARPVRVGVALGAVIALLLSAASGCFSDHSVSTGPPAEGECSVAIGGGIVGSTQALVAIKDFSFQPAEVRVAVGTKVTWINCEPTGTPAHTSTSDGGLWSSPRLEPGTTFSHTFDQAGRFPFHCEPHPFMTAAVVVE